MKHALTLALLWAFLSASANAAPGEWWEITSKTEMPGMPFSMPATTTKVCVAKEAANDPRQSMQQDKDCKMTDLKTSGNKTTWKMRCDRDGEVMNGTGEYTSLPDGYQGVTQLSGKSGGQPMNMTSHYRGKRLGTKCDSAELPRASKSMSKDMKSKGAEAPAEKSSSATGKPDESSMDSVKKLKGMFGF